jgi:hypothetical protein
MTGYTGLTWQGIGSLLLGLVLILTLRLAAIFSRARSRHAQRES